MKYLNGLFEKFRKTPDSVLNNLSLEKENIASDIALVLKEEEGEIKDNVDNAVDVIDNTAAADYVADVDNNEDKVELKSIKKRKNKKTSKIPAKKKNEYESDEFDEEDDGYNEYYNKYNYETSLFNQILIDPVLRYGLENGKWKFLSSVKYGNMTDEYEKIKHEMIDNGSENFAFKGSLLQKISESYVYFRALEKLDTKFLDKLRNGTLLYNDYKKFAEGNNIDIIIGSLGSKKYYDFISSKNLH